jgi:hypothetical protein
VITDVNAERCRDRRDRERGRQELPRTTIDQGGEGGEYQRIDRRGESSPDARDSPTGES